ncbi:GIY-YIG nuclease family protein [Trichocoleus sp. FACHB-262]|uniref:GIY-YIG nuclease family protein n=1 Tax=Trichocoleus sp. FACHB-262 TaxID=2692869 RepID=UPI001682B35D|nr:GIY-YIG nuclease family protein [Trichocoleus sp. FACHB-262]MBD2120286.1 GIY-YIG nuclease family protein [Trichocoleus sp. FACHB-262]
MTTSEEQARASLDRLAFLPFDSCLPITREFNDLPRRPGLYAIRHRHEGLLYLGKTNTLETRFNGGHKAFTWAWLDRYPPDDIRIAIAEIERWGNRGLLSELEAILLRATEPPYNARIPMES